MSNIKSLNIGDKQINLFSYHEEDYICLTDMIKYKDKSFAISDWLRNKQTLDFIEVWEEMNNSNFNYGEFAIIKNEARDNGRKISVKDLIKRTNTIGIISKTGRYGGTYAHKDIAFEFGTWISASFKYYLIKEFQSLKEIENNEYSLERNVKRVLTKVNYSIYTDAVKDFVIPKSKYVNNKKYIEYAEEADILNLCIFGCTAKEWKEANPSLAMKGDNLRDIASINELAVLSNLQVLGSEMMKTDLSRQERFNELQKISKKQLEILNKKDFMGSLKYTKESVYLENDDKNEKQSNFNKPLK